MTSRASAFLAVVVALSVRGAPLATAQETSPAVTGSLARPGRLGLELTGRHLSPSDQAFRDIYGGGAAYGVEASLTARGRLDVLIGLSRLAREGELTFTSESTRLSVIRLDLAARRRFLTGRATPYAGAGVSWYSFEERNQIGQVRESGPGLLVFGGGLVDVARWAALDLRVAFTRCSMSPAGVEISLGGLELGGGLLFRF